MTDILLIFLDYYLLEVEPILLYTKCYYIKNTSIKNILTKS
jgi:hypothetical protein